MKAVKQLDQIQYELKFLKQVEMKSLNFYIFSLKRSNEKKIHHWKGQK